MSLSPFEITITKEKIVQCLLFHDVMYTICMESNIYIHKMKEKKKIELFYRER